MAKSGNVVVLTNVRAVGTKMSDGTVMGGIYYPAHVKNGKQVSARWEGNVIINGAEWTDANGQRHEGSTDAVRLIVWNSKNAAAGKGFADIFAKCVSPGKELSCTCKIHTFQKRIFVNGQPLVGQDGQPITYQAVAFRVVDDVIFGSDSARQIEAEVGAYNGQMNFFSRPRLWNVPGEADNEAWKQINAWRMSQVWDGQSGTYGYARVIVPEGAQIGTVTGAAVGNFTQAQPAQPVVQQPVAGIVQPGAAPTVAAGAVQAQAGVAQPVAAPAGCPI